MKITCASRTARALDIPFCVAGGLRSVAEARAVLRAGADKVSVNSPALHDPPLVTALAAEFGSQCVVVGIDSQRDADGEYRVRRFSGDAARMHALPLRTFDWIAEAVALGAGEIVLNCIDVDGVREGFDVEQLRAARALCPVPLVASGGAGCAQHFATVFEEADVDAALAASVFHSGALPIPELKEFLHGCGIPVRRSSSASATMGAADVLA